MHVLLHISTKQSNRASVQLDAYGTYLASNPHRLGIAHRAIHFFSPLVWVCGLGILFWSTIASKFWVQHSAHQS